jgi:two-component system, chemotaxis family, chemotaxis protein CheY
MPQDEIVRGSFKGSAMKLCLIVDNSSVVRKVAKYVLNSMGYEVIEAENGQHAIEQCQLRLPDAILIDRDMPLMGGQDFLTMFIRTLKKRKPYIVYSTIENDTLDIARALSMGADDYVLKPYERDDLISKFDRSLLAA